MQPGESRRGVLATPYAAPLAARLADVTVRVFIQDPSGTQSYGGTLWSPATSVRWTTVVEPIDFGSGVEASRILEVRLGLGPVTFAEWRAVQFTDPDELADPLVSGPLAEPFGEGIMNLMRYALGVPAGEPGVGHLPSILRVDDGLAYTFHFDPALNDISYRVEASEHPGQWGSAEVVFDSIVDPPTNWENGILTVHLPIDPEEPHMFYRLRIHKHSGE